MPARIGIQPHPLGGKPGGLSRVLKSTTSQDNPEEPWTRWSTYSKHCDDKFLVMLLPIVCRSSHIHMKHTHGCVTVELPIRIVYLFSIACGWYGYCLQRKQFVVQRRTVFSMLLNLRIGQVYSGGLFWRHAKPPAVESRQPPASMLENTTPTEATSLCECYDPCPKLLLPSIRHSTD